jgi:hypothetical protein
MANFALLATFQQAGTGSAVALPSTVPASPSNLGSVRGEGVRVIIANLKASSGSLFYGGAGVTTGTGKEVPPGTSDTIIVNDTAEIYIVGATSTASVAVFSNVG